MPTVRQIAQRLARFEDLRKAHSPPGQRFTSFAKSVTAIRGGLSATLAEAHRLGSSAA
jgi:hypothetical protein